MNPTRRHAKREDHYADCEPMKIICAAAAERLDAPRAPLFEVVTPRRASLSKHDFTIDVIF